MNCKCGIKIDDRLREEKGKHVNYICSCGQKLQWHFRSIDPMPQGYRRYGGAYECPGKGVCDSYQEDAISPDF